MPVVQEYIHDGELQLANGQSVPIIAGGCTIDSLDFEKKINLHTGLVCLYAFMFLFCLVFAMFCARLFICALWSPAGKGLTSWLSFVVSSVSLSLSHWYPGSGVVLDCIDS